MSDKSTALLALYQKLIDQVKAQYAGDPELTTKDLLASVTSSSEFLKLKKSADKDELALVEHFLKRDIVSFLSEQHADDVSYSPTLLTMENTLWHWLSEITDRSQVEWHELARDLKTEGHYRSGEIINQGRVICTRCGHAMNIEFPGVIPDCPQCDNDEFTRESLAP
ncbi:MAG: zinc ribbon-containing protein [Shewanella sp.]|nr:zinc ribbon-containing protein [Shewanella sp.]MCF1429848.1 zinc ribbon-containing protein [Shewanella sp.]MCF1438696.1 zinc ribbon-containing protein [Shewanella sp.]MCF1458190.1 zinc ribbon-containing protein [Shewanella sp.]